MLADRCVHQRVQAQPLPLQVLRDREAETRQRVPERYVPGIAHVAGVTPQDDRHPRSEEHTSELQSRSDLVCRLLLEKKKKEEPSAWQLPALVWRRRLASGRVRVVQPAQRGA